MLEFSDLTKFDFEILEYVKDNGPISEEKIISHFDSDPDVTSLRIHELSKASYNMNYPNNKGFPISISDSSYLDKAYSRYHDEDGMPQSEYTGSVSISRRGKKLFKTGNKMNLIGFGISGFAAISPSPYLSHLSFLRFTILFVADIIENKQ